LANEASQQMIDQSCEEAGYRSANATVVLP
jgi:hypothetical protein